MERILARTFGENIELRTVVGPDLPPITMDRSKLEQVPMNAVMNSRAAMPGGGRLTIGTGSEGDGVRARPGHHRARPTAGRNRGCGG
jgi:signal transduction histidine kinase